jgi:hypothetical protein
MDCEGFFWKPILPFFPKARDEIGVLRRYRQVFGLAGLETFLLAVASQFAVTNQCMTYGGRSCLPLRDSSGFTPDSLSR